MKGAPLLAAAALLAGCASSGQYACGVPDGVGCRPVSEVYQEAVDGTLPASRAPETGKRKEEGTGAGTAPALRAAAPLRGASPLRGVDARQGTGPMPGAALPSAGPVVATIRPGDPILTRPQVLRVWIGRWTDKEGDLHDETYLYLRLDEGRWQIR